MRTVYYILSAHSQCWVYSSLAWVSGVVDYISPTDDGSDADCLPCRLRLVLDGSVSVTRCCFAVAPRKCSSCASMYAHFFVFVYMLDVQHTRADSARHCRNGGLPPDFTLHFVHTLDLLCFFGTARRVCSCMHHSIRIVIHVCADFAHTQPMHRRRHLSAAF